MRRILYLVRHAEALSVLPDVTDKQRALTHQGEQDALKLGIYIMEKNSNLDLILASPANRALSTAQIIAQQVSYDLKNIRVEESIYSANKFEIIKLFSKLTDSIQQVILVGHYPTIVELYNYLSANDKKLTMNPAEMCSLLFDLPWAEVTSGCGYFKLFISSSLPLICLKILIQMV
jgi:phosphohistidine phosphatase